MEGFGAPCAGAGWAAEAVVDSTRGEAGGSGVLLQEVLTPDDNRCGDKAQSYCQLHSDTTRAKSCLAAM
jgi:hypothetical protein